MVEPGATAAVHLTVSLDEDGGTDRIVETTDVDLALGTGTYDAHQDYEPIEFEVGAGEVLPGIDAAVRKMEVGETRTVELSPDEAFGSRSEDRVVDVPREPLEDASGRAAETGAMVQSARGDVGWIDAVTEDEVTIDFNHELAGEPVVVEIRLLDVTDDEGEGESE